MTSTTVDTPESSLSAELALPWLARQSQHGKLYRWLYLAALADTPLAILQAAALALLAARLLGEGALLPPALALITLLAVRAGAAALRARFTVGVAADITCAVRNQLAAMLLRGRAVRLSSGEASTTLLEQAEAVGRYHAGFALQRRVASLATLLFLIVAFATDWIVGLIFLLTAPLVPVFMTLVGTGAQQAADRQLESLRFLGGYFLDRLRGILTLRAFGREHAEQQAVAAASEEFRRRTMKVLRIAFLTSAVLELFAALSVALVALYVGLHLLNLMSFGPGQLLDFRTGLFLLLLAPEFYQPLRQLAAGYHERAAAQSAAEILAPLLQEQTDEQQASASTLGSAPAICMNTVTFRYPDSEQPTITRLDANLPAGHCLVIRGDSGTGKTTLLKLIAGLLLPDAGQIRHDDQLLRPLAAEPGRLAWAGQHPWFIHGTVADNLRQAAPEANDAALHQVLARCALSDLPLGLDTPLDENGGGLSGGQGRRLGLARALLSPASLLLLDEPTAELDPATEAHIIQTLRKEKGQRTIVIATHSTACAALADQSLWLGEPAPESGGQPDA